MNKTRCVVVALIVGGFLAIFILVAGGTSLYLLNRYLGVKQAASTTPVVFIRSANEGVTMQEGDPYLVSVTASDSNPISRLEMWLDGELAETQTPDPAVPGGALNFHALFNPSLDGGFHTLYWRAADIDGLIGQSQLIAVEVQSAPSVEADQEPGTEEPLTSSAPGDQTEEPPEVVFQSPSNQPQPTPDEDALEAGEEPPDQDTVAPINPQDIGELGQGFSPMPDPPPGVTILEVMGTAIDLGGFISGILSITPAAPTGLQAGFEDCTVRLVWYDSADNETGFNIWIQRLGGPPQLVATLNGSGLTGPVMYEFPAPPFGIYSVWVEAVNGVLSQPSEIKGLAINDADCPQNALAGMLEIEAIDMGVYTKADQVYCYMSLEGWLHQRVPDSEWEYIKVSGITGEIKEHWSGDSHILLPIPADEEVTLEGKCLIMGANGPVEMGEKFQASVPKEQWDGRRLEVKVGSMFTIGYRIRYFGPQQVVKGKAKFIDTSIPQPTGLRIVVESSPDPVENDKLARHPTLYWKWKGDPSLLRGGFNILNYGKYFSAGPMREARQQLTLPTSCGSEYDFQVEASYGYATSIPSPTLHHAQPPCKVMAEVHFQSIYAYTTDDSTDHPFQAASGHPDRYCDVLKVFGFYYIGTGADVVNEALASSDSPVDFQCNIEYSLKQLGASDDTYILPLDPNNPTLEVWLKLYEDDFWDNDEWGEVRFIMNDTSIDDWRTYDRILVYHPADPDDTAGGVVVKFRVRGILYGE